MSPRLNPFASPALALQLEDGKIAAIFVVRNPDKLRHLAGGAVH